MSTVPQSRKMWITPLSPVHMGTDEDYVPTGYVIEGNALYEFDSRALENLPPAERRALNQLLAGKATAELLKNVQAFFYRNREWLIPAAVNVAPVSEEMSKLYQARVGRAANIESGGKMVFNSLAIERASYHAANRRLFFPGSGLKGAMRTALLDNINNGQSARQGERNRELQQRLFRYSMRDLHKDPMRLIQVGDCAWHGKDNLNSAEVLFAVNRKKYPVVKNGRPVISQAEQHDLYQMLECATPFRFRAYRGLLNIADLSGFHSNQDKLPERRFGFREIAAACNRFYRPILDAETRILKNRGYLDANWRSSLETLLADASIRSRLDNNEAFLLRVGRHSGAESVTINGARNIKIMNGKGKKPTWASETKTLWLATSDKNDQCYLRPFGWLLVELTEPDETPAPWPEAETLIAVHEKKMRQWLDAVQRRRQSLQTKVQEAKKQWQRQARETAKREAAEKAEQAAEKIRLASMSPLERQIEELCRQDVNNPAAVLFNKLKAGEWQSRDEQRVVAAKIRALWQDKKCWIPAFGGTNKQKVRQRDKCLKVQAYLDDNPNA